MIAFCDVSRVPAGGDGSYSCYENKLGLSMSRMFFVPMLIWRNRRNPVLSAYGANQSDLLPASQTLYFFMFWYVFFTFVSLKRVNHHITHATVVWSSSVFKACLHSRFYGVPPLKVVLTLIRNLCSWRSQESCAWLIVSALLWRWGSLAGYIPRSGTWRM